MAGFEKFQSALVGAFRKDFKQLLRDKKKADLLAKEFEKEIFDLGPAVPLRDPTGRQRYLQRLLLHFSEIMLSPDTLKDIEFYIGRFPYRASTVSKHRH